ncbi:MAG TPA: electron transfer flavoprotein subunit beta, partial [Longimicrobiales bacterium]|nr:electron transfer flavoprotein subunit beta [Longimicrobiales bacterium]
MKIIVCIKRVPDTEARIKVASGGAGIDTAGVKFVISPYDEFALETALRIKEAEGAGELMVISLGEAQSAEQLRSALAMGADRAILLKGQPTLDGSATAKALAAEIKTHSPDLVL